MIRRGFHTIHASRSRHQLADEVLFLPGPLLADNKHFHICSSLTWLASLPHLKLLDFRGVHTTGEEGYWCAAKCTTMEHLSRLAKALKSKHSQPRLLMDI